MYIQKFTSLLRDFVSIKSISTDPSYASGVIEAARWVAQYAKSNGLMVKTVKGFGNPIVIARSKPEKNKTTVLVYGHYDVQPASKKDGWKTDPFVLTQKGSKLFARGAADNKAQILTHLFVVGNLLKKNMLGFNVIFLIEGNEETGSGNLPAFVQKHRKDLACDCILISDGELARDNHPRLEAGFRGGVNLEVQLITARDDVHSGLFGGVMPSAAHELAKLISTFHDRNGRIQIPGFYEGCEISEPSDEFDNKALLKLTGSQKIFARNPGEFDERVGKGPALEVTGLEAGFIGAGFRNSIPARATAKINIRSAPYQDPKVLVKKLKSFLLSNTPDYCRLRISPSESISGMTFSLENPFAQRAKDILEEVHGKTLVAGYSGGTLPIANEFKRVLKVPQLLVPLANFDCGMHSASENIGLAQIKKGLKFSERFFSR